MQANATPQPERIALMFTFLLCSETNSSYMNLFRTGSVDYLQELLYDFWKYTQLLSFFKCSFVLGASSSITFRRRQTCLLPLSPNSRWINSPAGEVDSVALCPFKCVQYQSYTALVCWRP